MLVLSRKVGESFVIGNNMRVQVIRVQGGRVKLAIEAPTNIAIRRQELLGDEDVEGAETEGEDAPPKVGHRSGSHADH